MPSDEIIKLCSSDETIISAVAANPKEPVSKAIKTLFKSHSKSNIDTTAEKDQSALDRAAQCGKFPYRPSDLFLQIYDDVLSTLAKDPLAGIVSPSLLGSSGVVQLTVVSVIPDIIRHYAELIVRAKTEIFLATNYWENSNSARLISDSFRELSKRTQARNGEKIIVKLMYDRGTPSQAIKNHALVPPKGWGEVGLPAPEEMPYVDLEVVNFHRPLLGTFHAKYLVVDRKVACIDSNNVQDRPNVEMMVHLEGPIVDSFYDMALWSWSVALTPPLPLLGGPSAHRDSYQFNRDNEYLKYIDPEASAVISRKFVQRHHELAQGGDGKEDDGWYRGWASKVGWINNDDRKRVESQENLVSQHPGMKVPTADESKQHDEADGNIAGNSADGADTGAGTDAAQQGNEAPGQQSHDGVADGGEKKTNENLAAAIAQHLNAGDTDLEASAADDETMGEFRPHILHAPHDPVPIVMVNRPPTGTPGHAHIHDMPQDVAFLGAFKYAQQSIFVQSPTYNASPLLPATLDACRRGIQVTLYLDLGFNDQGEMIPFQGGANEEFVNKLYKALNEEGKGHEANLKVYWYTSKDQTKPLSAAAKKRNCHVKFMAIDDTVAILGNGNQDTQSWFHSQEVNVMIDSKQLVAEWIKGINANQNTYRYGRVDSKDGVWRDKDGNVVEASGIKNVGVFGHMKGFAGAIARVQGKGGF